MGVGVWNRTRWAVAASALALGAAGVLAPQPAMAQSAPAAGQIAFNIPAQDLNAALLAFAERSGLQIVYDRDRVAGRRSGTVRGSHAPVEALSQLLTGTGFTYRISGDVVTLERAPQTADGDIQLDAVRVAGAGGTGGDAAVTENSGAYTTRATGVATKLPMSIRETPQSVTVVTSQMMEDRRIDDFADIIEHTTGLSINRYESNRGSMFSRGFKIENFLINGAPTSINEQWSAGEILNNTAIYDRVEVLRGSNGLMMGTGNPSAIINMVRKRADSDVLTGSLSVEAGSWSQHGLTVDISSPLTASGATRARFVVDYDDSENYVDRLENRSYVLFGTVEQDIGDRTLLSAGVSYQDNQTDSPTWGGIPAWQVNSADEVVRLDLGRGANTSADWTYWNSEYTNAFVSAEHDFGNGWNAKASYTRGERDSESNIVLYYPYPIDQTTGNSVMSLFGFKIPMPGYAGIYYVDNVKEDINIQVDGEFSLFGRRHELIFGYDHMKEKLVADGSPGSITIANTPDVYQFDASGAQPNYVTRQNYQDHEITQEALFAAGRFYLMDSLKLIVGARLIDYSVTDNRDPSNDFDSDNEIIPYAGLVFDINRNLSAYASYTSIFQPQNYRDADGGLLSPIEGNTYEAGLKAEFFDGRLNATLSVFRMEQSNVSQYSGLVPEDPANPGGPQRSAYIAVDGVVSEGFEAEIFGEIRPNWNLFVGYSQSEATQPSGADVNTLVPREQFNVFTTYQLPGAWRALTIGGGVRWQSEIHVHQQLAAILGVPRLEQGSYFVADLMARYRINDNWSAQLNVNNMLDEDYYAPTEDGMQIYWQPPRSANFELKYRF